MWCLNNWIIWVEKEKEISHTLEYLRSKTKINLNNGFKNDLLSFFDTVDIAVLNKH